MDFARAVLFSLGLVLHAAYLCEERGAAYGRIFSVIHAFRMESFFLIAGFFAAGTLVRATPEEFLRKRVVRLGVPLFFCAVALNGLVNLFACPEVWGEPSLLLQPSFWLKGRWHQAGHLWFLGTLIVYTVGVAVVHSCIPRADEMIRRPVCGLGRFLALSAATYGLLFMAARAIPTPPWGKLWIFVDQVATLQHLSFFVSGYVLFHRRELFEGLIRQPVLNFAGVGLYWLVGSFGTSLPMGGWLQASLQGLYIFNICGLLFWLARRGTWARHPSVQAFAAAAYTVYLVHWPVMVVMDQGIDALGWPASVAFAVLVLGSGVVAVGVHSLLVARSQWLAFLLNGALPRRSRGRSDVAGMVGLGVEPRPSAMS